MEVLTVVSWIFQRSSSLSHKMEYHLLLQHQCRFNALVSSPAEPTSEPRNCRFQVVRHSAHRRTSLSALASLAGFNVSTSQGVAWDKRIPLITDSNYPDVTVRESMTAEEEEERVWSRSCTCPSHSKWPLYSFTAQSLPDSQTPCPST